MTDLPHVYFVKHGQRPHMTQGYLVKEYADRWIVRDRPDGPNRSFSNQLLTMRRLKVYLDRKQAVGALLANLQAAKRQAEERVGKLDKLIKKVIDEEGL